MAGPGTVQAAVAFLSPGILLWGHLIIFINFVCHKFNMGKVDSII